jgi:hypothetical protein
MNAEQRALKTRRSILLTLLVRHMVKMRTDENSLKEHIKESSEKIDEALSILLKEGLIEKSRFGTANHFEISEKAIEKESFYLASLLEKMIIWCE